MSLDKPAANQRAVLNEFQRKGWPEWIANPLKPSYEHDDRNRLRDAVYRLNRNIIDGVVRFRRDGKGEGVIWEAATKKRKSRKRQ